MKAPEKNTITSGIRDIHATASAKICRLRRKLYVDLARSMWRSTGRASCRNPTHANAAPSQSDSATTDRTASTYDLRMSRTVHALSVTLVLDRLLISL